MRRHPLKSLIPVVAALTLAFASSQAIAQSQQDQQSCEGDVYELCADKIPDEDDIVVCLRKQWSKVSKQCRKVMTTYAKNHGKKRQDKEPKKEAETGKSAAY